MVRVRFAPSPTGSLHVGNALSAVVNRREPATGCCSGSTTRIPPGTSPGARRRSSDDLGWLGIDWDEGPVRQSSARIATGMRPSAIGTDRFDGITLLREDGTATYHLASVVDDADFGITRVYRG